ncbi:DUF3253 domain-containing protein [Herbiconiux sp. A18JL235]|uniref:DUF3253 domain-containing protein n=1 Tax=Herbiconiux sp. A18JL235 TaxID=3152363 RepID=A0AB39BIT2_9MICO
MTSLAADDLGTRLESTILDLLARRAPSTICPSDAARAAVEGTDEPWRPLMEPVRDAARRLVARGEVEVTQHGEVIDPTSPKGPIRIRLTER